MVPPVGEGRHLHSLLSGAVQERSCLGVLCDIMYLHVYWTCIISFCVFMSLARGSGLLAHARPPSLPLQTLHEEPTASRPSQARSEHPAEKRKRTMVCRTGRTSPTTSSQSTHQRQFGSTFPSSRAGVSQGGPKGEEVEDGLRPDQDRGGARAQDDPGTGPESQRGRAGDMGDAAAPAREALQDGKSLGEAPQKTGSSSASSRSTLHHEEENVYSADKVYDVLYDMSWHNNTSLCPIEVAQVLQRASLEHQLSEKQVSAALQQWCEYGVLARSDDNAYVHFTQAQHLA